MGKINLDPYLFFRGNCAEAMDFYKSIFGGELSMMKFDDMPMPGMDNAEELKGKIMHALLDAGDIRLMASDTTIASEKAAKIELSLSGEDETKLRGYFDGLSAGGTIKSPLKKEMWGDIYGQLTDKFSIDWMINITAPKV